MCCTGCFLCTYCENGALLPPLLGCSPIVMPYSMYLLDRGDSSKHRVRFGLPLIGSAPKFPTGLGLALLAGWLVTSTHLLGGPRCLRLVAWCTVHGCGILDAQCLVHRFPVDTTHYSFGFRSERSYFLVPRLRGLAVSASSDSSSTLPTYQSLKYNIILR